MSEDKSKKAQPEISDEELEGVAGGNATIDGNGTVTITNPFNRKVKSLSNESAGGFASDLGLG